ncbi:Heptaprenyl diphosphate synthase component 1 [Anoxybacillus sp. P3H1B]|uniref:Heptaprenyl diphosphate synthase component 1 n=1 Tax=Anoxybacteroides rupiense TaxID=311460 RepID=A0ABD5IUJ5_9BACL|nr:MULTISPECIES: heptaprenyl diphosphate synthase component 1 [Anoxybacillus]KXG11047.1 Heptaprenyl diphosphate synthase component 1 [Anoxybacillus sp. P3H1B]MBB3906623.1 heptaprenyl diphosphate synthase [Anoxybacillus rupiensis]MED5051997.1 heptaprenyl diphosphate synthase component 1 [Anoxybacillus rupiensis]
MIVLEHIMKKIAVLKEQIGRFLHHPYLLQHISAHVIDEDRILLSLSMLESADLSFDEIDGYVVPMMLVQIALDTHDEVTNSLPQQQDRELKTRQLTVLAGDLYSGLYYDYLAKKNNLEMIHVFAQAIKEINEHKIRLYQKDITRIEALFHSVAVIESSLIYKIGEHISLPSWSKFAYYFLLLKRIAREKERLMKHGTSVLFDQMASIVFPKNKGIAKEQKHYLSHICNRYIEHCKEELLNMKLECNELLQTRLSELISNFSVIVKKTVEEG